MPLTHGPARPEESVGPRKQVRLRRLARAWLATEPAPRHDRLRFDVIGVYWPPSALAPAVEHRSDVVG